MGTIRSPDHAQMNTPEPRILPFASYSANTRRKLGKAIVPTTIPIVRITPDEVSHVTVTLEYRGNFRNDRHKDPFTYVLASLGLD